MLIHCCELFCFLFQLLILKVKVHVCDLIHEILFMEQYKKKKKASKSMAFTFYSTQHQSLFYKLSFVFPKPQTQAKGFQKCFRTYRTPLMYLLLRSFISFNKYLWNTLCMLDISPRDKKGNNKAAVLPEKAAWRNTNRKRNNGKMV